jgi:MYXO-CTERM domain-containing protein
MPNHLMRRAVALLCAMVGQASANGAVGTPPIIGGTLDSGDPGVVALVADPGGLRCTGVLIAPRVVLTAAHCLFRWRDNALAVGVGPEQYELERLVPVVDARRHPHFTLAPEIVRDVGIMLLAEPLDVPTWPIYPLPIDDTIIGKQLRLVGYGEDDTETPEFAGTKAQGSTIIESFDWDAIAYSAMPNTTCIGDSGSPNFIVDEAGVEHIIAITSSGDFECTHGFGTRLDLHIDNFIEPYIAATSPGAAQPGDACFYDEQCAEGYCTPAYDEPALKFCSTRCDEDADCRSGMMCSAFLCRWPRPTPGADGSPCQVDQDCVSDLCGTAQGETGGRCGSLCVPMPGIEDIDRLSCADGYSCVEDTRQRRYLCVADDSSGCGCRSSNGNGALALVLLLFVRRRRPRGRTDDHRIGKSQDR